MDTQKDFGQLAAEWFKGNWKKLFLILVGIMLVSLMFLACFGVVLFTGMYWAMGGF